MSTLKTLIIEDSIKVLKNLIKKYNNPHIQYEEVREGVHIVSTIDTVLPVGIKDFIRNNFIPIDDTDSKLISFKNPF